MDDHETEMEMASGSLVSNVKESIRDTMEVPLDRQRLLFKGRML